MQIQRDTPIRVLGKVGRLPRLFRDLGTGGALRYLGRRLRHPGGLPVAPPQPKFDLLEHFEFLIAPPLPVPATADCPPRSMNWVIPSFEAGSGGHMTIFRIIGQLERRGYRCRIVIVGPTRFRSSAEARSAVVENFMPLKAEVNLGETALEAAEFTVATEWSTAYTVRRFNATQHKLYFIQDMEPAFFPCGSHYAFAEATYRFGFTALTVGNWLAEQACSRYGMRAYPFQMGFPAEYQHAPLPLASGPEAQRSRVFFYARHVTPRRGFELGLLALTLVHRASPETEFVFAGWDVSAFHIPFPHRNAGVVPHAALAEIYAGCDVALVLSLTNLSLLPIELMACGCPVVSNRGPNVEWQLRDGDNALLADATPQALSDALLRVLREPTLRRSLRDNGRRFAASADWAQEGERVAGYLDEISRSA